MLCLDACATHHPQTPVDVAAVQTVAVRPNETVYDVAKRLNIGVRDLIDANHLSPPYALTPGQTLIVPVPQAYTVIKGDTLYGIARRFNVDQTRIAQMNHLQPPYTIFVGQQLELPNHHGGPAVEADAAALPPVAAPVNQSTQVESAPLPPPKAQPEPGKTDLASPIALAPPAQTKTAAVALPEPEPANAPTGFLWPVRGEIVSPFGEKPGGLHNDGINIAAAEGTPVKSAAAGTVAYAGNELKGFGNLILIRHGDGWVTAYAHLATMSVKKGDAVRAGQGIGTVGQTGTIDSPQLHFELRHGKDAVDPAGKLS